MSASRWSGADSRKARKLLAPLVIAGAVCWRCGKPILATFEGGRWHGQRWQADHVTERTFGGRDDPSNLAPCHAKCNEVAGAKIGAAITNAKKIRRASRTPVKKVREGSFDGPKQPACNAHTSFLLSSPPDLDVKARATILSPWPEDTDISEAEEGARWLGLPLLPQGIQIASVLQAVEMVPATTGTAVVVPRPVYRTVPVEVPRRSQKTTAILEVLLGRCLNRPGYKVASTAQTGTKARSKLLEVQAALIAAGFEIDGLGKCLAGMGDTRIRFANGSLWQSLPPDPAAFRSEAYDAVLVDEAGELDPEKGEALLAGLLPTGDTRPGFQLIVAGTPGEVRAGLLWSRLEALRAGKPRVGGVVYEAPDRSVFLDPETGEPDWPMLLRTHPGIGTLTDAETVAGNLDDMGVDRWQREYLCQWPRNAGASALDVAAWEACVATGTPEVPSTASVAWSVDKDGGMAALVAAWRDDRGRACFRVLEAAPGYDWLPREAKKAQEVHRGALGYDAIGAGIEVADRMSRAPFRVRLRVVKLSEQVGAAARLDREISHRNVRQWGDQPLTEAVETSAWRPVANARLFLGKPGSCVLIAAADALWVFDRSTPSTGRRVRIVSTAGRSTTGRAAR